jgi:hypothetical protein
MNDSNRTNTERRIPEFKTIEEAAEFWDTHSSAEFEDEFEDADDIEIVGVIAPGYLPVTLDDDTLEALIECSVRKDISLSDMLQGWIEERLAAERKSA